MLIHFGIDFKTNVQPIIAEASGRRPEQQPMRVGSSPGSFNQLLQKLAMFQSTGAFTGASATTLEQVISGNLQDAEGCAQVHGSLATAIAGTESTESTGMRDRILARRCVAERACSRSSAGCLGNIFQPAVCNGLTNCRI